MKLVNSAVNLFFKSRYHRIERMLDYPIETQRKLFKTLINAAKDTEWGQKHDYASINDEATFRQKVPVGDYESHKEDIERMMRGEANVLWRGTIKWFSKSSGTTNDKSKFLPVSDEILETCHFQGSRDTLSMYVTNQPNPKYFKGYSLLICGALSSFEQHPETTFGDVSAIMVANLPSFYRLFYKPTYDIALLAKWEDKLEATAQQVMNENITMIGGVPTWNLVLFRRILELTGKKNMLEVWPNFEVYIHGGVNFEPYRAQFKELLPADRIQYREVYNASEGYFASQLYPDDDDMLLFLDNGIYYEFVPMNDWSEGSMDAAIPLSEVKKGVNYAMLISTNAGLWRYHCGDTVIFTSIFPFKIKITGRTKHFINAFGEEVMVANTDKAIAMTCETLNAIVEEYTAAPIYISGIEGRGGHEWIIEFDKPPADYEAFADLLDENLQSINSDYEAKRFKNLALNRLKINVVPQETFLNWMKYRGKFGGQNKIPRLSNNRKYVEEILQFAVSKSQ